MRRIAIEFDGVVVTARLLDEAAPKTCQALWEILPFEDRVTHAKWSGQMFHTNTPMKVKLDADYPFGIENPSGFQAPGDVVYFHPIRELAVAYGEAQFCWMTGPLLVTRVAVIEDGLEAFAKKGDRLQWEGAKPFVVRQK